MKTSSIIVTALCVGAGGVIAGTLFATGRGSKMRNKMARKGKLYKDYLMDKFYDYADSIPHPFEGMEDQTIRLSKKAIYKAEKIKAEALQKVNNENH